MNSETSEDPRLTLAKILADLDQVRRLDEAAQLAQVQPISLYLLAARWRWPIPAGRDIAEFVQNCVRCQWIPIPAGLEPPKNGDLAVITDSQKVPSCVQVVQQVHTEGRWWNLVANGQHVRQNTPTADYWLRMYCRECEAKKQQEQPILQQQQRAQVQVPPSGVLSGVTTALPPG